MAGHDDERELFPLTVSDIKQYLYCPRIVYFRTILPVQHTTTFKMEYGKETHLKLDRLEKRRTLARYRLSEGTREFHVYVHSERLALSGVLDMLLRTTAGMFPVEFKVTTSDPGLNHKYQLIAYAMLLEDAFGVQVRTGFLYLVPTERLYAVPITANGRLHTKRIMGAIRNMMQTQRIPAATRSRGRCQDCEFANYCRDIDRRRSTRYVSLPRGAAGG